MGKATLVHNIRETPDLTKCHMTKGFFFYLTSSSTWIGNKGYILLIYLKTKQFLFP